MKYDPDTTTVEFTVHVPVGAIAATYDDLHDNEEVMIPVAALMELLEDHKEHVSVHRIMMILMEHKDFDDAIASLGILQRYEAA